MSYTPKIKFGRWNSILALMIAVSTNHSLGEIVHKNQQDTPRNGDISKTIQDKNASLTPSVFTVSNFVEHNGQEFVSMDLSDQKKGTIGAKVDLYRMDQGISIKTGTVEIKEQSGSHVTAKVVENGSQESRILLTDYPGIMIGDLGRARSVKISKIIRVTPSKTVSYFDLFEDPNAYPKTFQLSERGKETLRAELAVFYDSKLPTLLVEGHTDTEGNSETNQVESYQRAMTIRQYLINELQFDPNRVVAIGMGEIEHVKEPYLPDHNRRARRIVFKAKGY